MRKAGLGDMYRQRPTEAVKAIENFTTAALAVAINHDPKPFLQAIHLVADWKPDHASPADAGTLLIDLADVRSASAETQVYLERSDGLDSGYLDLVVTLTDSRRSQEVWVEVKVDAGLTMHASLRSDADEMDQLHVYMEHRPTPRPGRPRSPCIVTLARERSLHADVPGISWDDLNAAAADADGAMWADLRIFLAEEGIVFPPLPAGLGGYDAYLAVFEGVNAEVKTMWTDVPSNMHTIGVANNLARNVTDRHEIFLTAQCLSYGLRMGTETQEWWIAVGNGSDFQKTHVPVETVVEAAQGGYLDPWERLDHVWRVDRFDVFEKRRPYAVEPANAPIDWFVTALRDIKESKVIEPYLQQRRLRTP